jgi:hypothetical protein
MIEIKSPMFLSSFVGTYDNILPKKACTKLIKIFEKSKFVQEQTAGNMVKDSSIRRGTEIFLANDEMKDILIKASFITLDKYIGLTKTTSRFISHHTENCRFEEFRIRKYGKNEGYFKEHCDIVGREGMSRLFVIMFYLNDVMEGGETEFTELGLLSHSEGVYSYFTQTLCFLMKQRFLYQIQNIRHRLTSTIHNLIVINTLMSNHKTGITMNNEEEKTELEELVSKEVRRKMARNMAKIAKKSSTKLKKARAALKIASPEKLKAKAHKKAKNFFVTKITGGKAWADLSDAEKINIEKKLVKKKAAIDKLAKKLLKQVKKDDLLKVKTNRAKES